MTTRLYDDGLFLPESPRWHEGALWISDIMHRTVFRYDEGRKRPVAAFEQNISGIGFAPDGALLVVSMPDRKVLRLKDHEITEHADLSHLEPTLLNDMVVTNDGTAYVTRFAWDPWKGEDLRMASVLQVMPDGTARSIGPDLIVPNGVAVTSDEATLYVAEAGGARVWAIDLQSPNFSAEVFSELPASPTSELGLATPDGICVDGANGLWVADPQGHRVVHLNSDGAIDRTLDYPCADQPLAVGIGGEDGDTLFIAISQKTDVHAQRTDASGRIEVFDLTTMSAAE